jgi:hypothetical protein
MPDPAREIRMLRMAHPFSSPNSSTGLAQDLHRISTVFLIDRTYDDNYDASPLSVGEMALGPI